MARANPEEEAQQKQQKCDMRKIYIYIFIISHITYSYTYIQIGSSYHIFLYCAKITGSLGISPDNEPISITISHYGIITISIRNI